MTAGGWLSGIGIDIYDSLDPLASSGLYTHTADEVIAMTDFGVFVDGVREWGRTERAKLGL